MTDQATLDQLLAAQDSARAAWATVAVYWWAFGATALGLILNALIALVAVRGPERDRHTRDLEDRIKRARIYARAALSALKGLSVARSLRKNIVKGRFQSEGGAQDLAHFCRRLDVRRKLIDHFIGQGLRDVNLVSWLFETSVLLGALHDSIDLRPAEGQDPTVVAAEMLTHREERMETLRTELQRFVSEKRAKDLSLQDDLDRVWSVAWLVQIWKKPETERD